MAEILDRLNEMNESGVITYSVYSELHDLASQLEERKVGKWVKKSQYGNDYCSECNYEYCGYGYPKYCPNCGAKMRGSKNE